MPSSFSDGCRFQRRISFDNESKENNDAKDEATQKSEVPNRL